MLTLVPEQIEQYAVNHTTPLEPHLSELAQYTRETVEMAGMLCGPMEGTLLRLLVWATWARQILDVGCFTGFSAQMMAAALPDDGKIITCEIDPATAAIAQEQFDRGPNSH